MDYCCDEATVYRYANVASHFERFSLAHNILLPSLPAGSVPDVERSSLGPRSAQENRLRKTGSGRALAGNQSVEFLFKASQYFIVRPCSHMFATTLQIDIAGPTPQP